MFRVYFQSGEFYGDQGLSWIVVFKDFLLPLAGIGIPLLLFYLGLRHERRRADRQRTEDQDKSDRIESLRLLYFHSLLIEVLKYCCHFQDVLESVKTSLETNKYNSENLALADDTDLKRIVVDLDRESLFYAYRERIEDQSLSIIFKALDTVYGQRRTFNDAWSRATKEISNKKNEISSSTAGFGLMVLDVNVDRTENLTLQEELKNILIAHSQISYHSDEQYQALVQGLAIPFANTIQRHGKSIDANWRHIFEAALDVEILDKRVESIVKWYLTIIEELMATLDRVVSDLFKHYLPLEDYLAKHKLLTERLSEQGDKTPNPDEFENKPE